MPNLLLLSNSTNHGDVMFRHAASAFAQVAGDDPNEPGHERDEHRERGKDECRVVAHAYELSGVANGRQQGTDQPAQ